MAASPPPELPGMAQARSDSKLFVNSVFDSAGGAASIPADLQAVRLRLEATECERLALSSELATTQTRLHDALEVLEGVLSERSSLRRQAHELQAQLAAALADQRSSRALQPSTSAASSPGSAGGGGRATPRQQLRQELVLAHARLGELQAAQRSWEAERQQVLQEVEEERQRLQEGLAQALTQATSAQREADAAAERASHWCSLAQVLQRSALLTEGPSPFSPASTSTASRFSPAGSAGPPSARSGPSSGGKGRSSAQDSPPQFSPPLSAAQHSRSRLLAGPGGGLGAGVSAGAGLISAFHAVAGTPGSAEKQLQGSPIFCESPEQRAATARGALAAADAQPRAARLAGGSAAGGSEDGAPAGVSASAELAPGTDLILAHKLPTPGLSCASSMNLATGGGGAAAFGGPSPLTPQPCLGCVAVTSGRLAGSFEQVNGGTPCASPGQEDTSPAASSVGRGRAAKAGRNGGQSGRRSFLGRLLMRSVCVGGLPAEGGNAPAVREG